MKPKHHGTPISFEGVFRKMAKQRRSKDELCDMGLRSLVHSRPAEIEQYEEVNEGRMAGNADTRTIRGIHTVGLRVRRYGG